MHKLAFVFMLVSLAGCRGSDADKAKDGPKPTPEAKATTPAAQGAATTQTAGGAANPAAPAVATAPGKPAPLPPGRSSPPTLAEWNSQQKEVTVKGSSALNCETKIVREYLRVSCHGKNDTGGTPTGIVIKKGGRGEAFTYTGGGIASLVVPFVEGIDFAADFSWSDKSHTLTAKWPRGSKRPEIVGVFEGAQSPLDLHSEAQLAEKLCACHKKVTKETTCDNMISSTNIDCDLTYGNDCERLLECSRGEPGVSPRCRPGYVNAVMGFCQPVCGEGKPPCPSGESCVDLEFAKICVPN